MKVIQLRTPKTGLLDITKKVSVIAAECKILNGMCQVFVPHTTAGITINENADPDVIDDMLAAFEEMVPKLRYLHSEGNSAAHVKASLVGASVTVPIVNGKLYLGTWQGIYFCEFDGPRQRSVCINILG
ncbi:secondary thiamine-phosphate synthase enzyme YjbQ [Dendrosporobacter sp. 1207_IL3150]|uniref:secondary thiamine-phosphate synthase enzyme YjbQ n=1 Tax=Dendrosporobacter sp. 1207_IL3150 TaxID=3084054 RepID=UPI002FDB4A20